MAKSTEQDLQLNKSSRQQGC